MKKMKFRPFWSYDVMKTEQWLAQLHAKGYALKDVYFKRRMFIFDSASKEEKDYFITYKDESQYKDTMLDTVCKTNHYKIARRDKSDEGIAPIHQGFFRKNETLKTIAFVFLMIQLFNYLIFLSLLFIVLFNSEAFTISYEESAFLSDVPAFLQVLGVLTLYASGIFIQGWLFYTYFKLRKSNYRLRGFETVKPDAIYSNASFTKQEIKALKKKKQVIKKIRLAWMYAPDKLETWLERMEEKGFNLIKINKAGIMFYFLKGESKKVKYHIDYQNAKDPEYFSINKESGWQLMFTSFTRRQSYTIFKQAYHNQVPQFYSDQESKLKHAKKLAFQHALFLIPFAIIYSLLLFSHVSRLSEEVGFFQAVLSFNIVVFSLVAVEFTYFAFQSIFYYFRVKRKILS